MLRRRVIPCLDVAGGRVVKGVQFVDMIDAGDPVELAGRYASQGADEICILDITASIESRGTLLNVVHRVAATVDVPLTVGGGVTSVTDMRDVLRAGADKVAINTAAVHRPDLIRQCADAFGSQSVVLAIDARENGPSTWSVYTHGGRNETDLDVIDWSRRGALLGAGELLVTSMDRDGTTEGYDLDLLASIRKVVDVPIIASGGAGNASDMADALTVGKADSVLAASIFHLDGHGVDDIKKALAESGLPMRTPSGVTLS